MAHGIPAQHNPVVFPEQGPVNEVLQTVNTASPKNPVSIANANAHGIALVGYFGGVFFTPLIGDTQKLEPQSILVQPNGVANG